MAVDLRYQQPLVRIADCTFKDQCQSDPPVSVDTEALRLTAPSLRSSSVPFSTSVKYSRPGETDGSRLLLVCEVALGRCRELQKKDPTLTCAPEGYDSVHGARSTPRQHSEFEVLTLMGEAYNTHV